MMSLSVGFQLFLCSIIELALYRKMMGIIWDFFCRIVSENFLSVLILPTLHFAYRGKDPVLPVRVEYGSRSSIDVVKVAEPLQVKSDEIY